MAANPPLNSVNLGASSIADDIGYVALHDLAKALDGITRDYRVIGGHMVTTLAARWQLGAGLYRETGDVDLGIPPIVARDHHIVGRLKDISYIQVAGNRFARELSDIPAGLAVHDAANVPQALIDVLVPAYAGRARENVQVAGDLFSTEVPGLHLAHARPPVTIVLDLRRRKLRRSAHRSVTALETDIRKWINEWNKDPKPFVWTKTADEVLETLAGYCRRVCG